MSPCVILSDVWNEQLKLQEGIRQHETFLVYKLVTVIN